LRHAIEFLLSSWRLSVRLTLASNPEFGTFISSLRTLSYSSFLRIPIEHRPQIEACLVRGAVYPETDAAADKQTVVMITPRGLGGIYNPSFDVTPADLITAIVTERGVASRKEGEETIELSDSGIV
jgi:methylthioribose-1-phosphate isomerase